MQLHYHYQSFICKTPTEGQLIGSASVKSQSPPVCSESFKLQSINTDFRHFWNFRIDKLRSWSRGQFQLEDPTHTTVLDWTTRYTRILGRVRSPCYHGRWSKGACIREWGNCMRCKSL